jgi:uncharacterized protein (DUF433 family)
VVRGGNGPNDTVYDKRYYKRREKVVMMKFERITIDPEICTGKPCIRGLRFPVSRLLGLLASGETREEILKEYPYLEPEDIDEALRYAAFLAEEETLEIAK